MAKLKRQGEYIGSADFITEALNVFLANKDLARVDVTNAGASVTLIRNTGGGSGRTFAIGFSTPDEDDPEEE